MDSKKTHSFVGDLPTDSFGINPKPSPVGPHSKDLSLFAPTDPKKK